MKTKQTILKAFASLALAMGAFASADAQTNLGSSCSCPAATTAARPIQNISTWAPFGYLAIAGTYGGELTGTDAQLVLTCDKTWILDKKIYIPAGKTLTIAPGALIKGAANLPSQPANATALIIERGGKIDAQGTKACPIVFTAFDDPMDGTYPITNIGKWGGVVILGKAKNNLTFAANGPFVPGGAGRLAVADGLGTVEGFASSNAQDQYGVATSMPSFYVSATIPGTVGDTISYSFNQTTSAASTAQTTALGSRAIIAMNGKIGQLCLNGMTVSGTGIPAGTTVFSVSGNSVTLSAVLAAGAIAQGTTITFGGQYPLPLVGGSTGFFYNYAQAGVATGDIPVVLSGSTGPFASGTSTNLAIPFIGGLSGAGSVPDDNDNSGIMKYVSIRHSGAILAVGAEINGLTLASVGRGTTIENIEIVACADDNVEIFGGTVNLKYITTIFGNDDMLDYDLGWTGKCQFFFGMTGNNTGTQSSPDADSGIEADADDNTSNLGPRSHPIIRNATFIGRNKTSKTADNTGLAAICAKDLTEGEIYSSIFANFKHGLWLRKALTAPRVYTSSTGLSPAGVSGTTLGGGEAWHNWRNTGTLGNTASDDLGNGSSSLKVKCNTFVGMSAGALINGDAVVPNASTTTGGVTTYTDAQYEQFINTDGNSVVASLPGFSYGFTINPANNSGIVKNDVTPFPAISNSTCPVDNDAFWTPTTYRGAFSSVIGQNWLSDWSYSQLLGTITTLGAAGSCPTDLNGDGYINVTDFNLFAPTFGNTCN